MATIKLKKSEYSNIPEGNQIVCVKSIDDSAYAEFDKLTFVLADKNGNTCKNTFSFIGNDGEPNDMATTIFTIMARCLMNDQTLDEIDYTELLGKFAEVEITHTEGSKGGTFANVKKWIGPAKGFDGAASAPAGKKKTAAELIAEARAKRG